MYWIPHPTVLEGFGLRLEPLVSSHIPELVRVGKDPQIWNYLPTRGAEKGVLETELRSAILKRSTGEQYPFTVISHGSIVGSTRFFDMHPDHKKLEIGATWYTPTAWGSGVNAACKFLLLQFCFESLAVQRVQLKTRDVNLRSQAAIRKLGAVQEGILRKDRILPTGETRDTVVFSILDEEWPVVKGGLLERISGIRAADAEASVSMS
jgi:RimJ/RimL family protein N-acetyltransferase